MRRCLPKRKIQSVLPSLHITLSSLHSAPVQFLAHCHQQQWQRDAYLLFSRTPLFQMQRHARLWDLNSGLRMTKPVGKQRYSAERLLRPFPFSFLLRYSNLRCSPQGRGNTVACELFRADTGAPLRSGRRSIYPSVSMPTGPFSELKA